MNYRAGISLANKEADSYFDVSTEGVIELETRHSGLRTDADIKSLRLKNSFGNLIKCFQPSYRPLRIPPSEILHVEVRAGLCGGIGGTGPPGRPGPLGGGRSLRRGR